MRLIYIFITGCLISLTACKNNEKAAVDNNNTAANTVMAPVSSRLNHSATQQLMGVVTRYYALKNALVAAKAPAAETAAAELALSARHMQTVLAEDTVNKAALAPFLDSVVTQCSAVQIIKDETCEQQRIVFEVISSNMYALLKKADVRNARIFHQYCPMAFNDKGAYWLSGESDILNPYFGKKMLECGEVTDSF